MFFENLFNYLCLKKIRCFSGCFIVISFIWLLFWTFSSIKIFNSYFLSFFILYYIYVYLYFSTESGESVSDYRFKNFSYVFFVSIILVEVIRGLTFNINFNSFFFESNIFLKYLLSISIFTIIIISLLFFCYDSKYRIQQFVLIYCVVLYIFTLGLFIFYDKSNINFYYKTTYFCLDSISLFFLFLITLLFCFCILLTWNTSIIFYKYYYSVLICLEILLIFLFSSLNFIVFYILFELILIPMLFIIGIWGSRIRKIKASFYFFLYTFIGSLFLLVGFLICFYSLGSSNYFLLLISQFSINKQLFLWILFFIGFAIKIPMFPFHIWLPEAHVEAPTVGSVLLAGILLKLGSYGFLRFNLILFPLANSFFLPLVLTLAFIGFIYSSFTILRQIDIKKIIAYSSIAHMNFMVLGLFSLDIRGICGSLLLMISHGFISSVLFILIGFLYIRTHSRFIYHYSGLNLFMPVFCVYFFIFNIANFSFPGTSNFIGEYMVFLGLLHKSLFLFIGSIFGLIFSAVYSLLLFNRMCCGTTNILLNVSDPTNSYNLVLQNRTTNFLNKPKIYTLEDITFRENFICLCFLFCILFLGLFPQSFLSFINYSILILY